MSHPLAGFRQRHQQKSLRFHRWTPGELFMGKLQEEKTIKTPKGKKKEARVQVFAEVDDEGVETGRLLMTQRIPVVDWAARQLEGLNVNLDGACFIVIYQGKKPWTDPATGQEWDTHQHSVTVVAMGPDGELVEMENEKGKLVFPKQQRKGRK